MINRFQEAIVWSSGKFRVDPQGRVWRGEKRAENRVGAYLQVKVMVDGIRRYTCAHRLVWHALVGPIPREMYINHLNGKKDDNRPENLQLCSASENHAHAHREGLVDQRGERNPAAKIPNATVARIRLRYAEGGVTQQALASEIGVSHKTISKIVRGERRQSQLGRVGSYVHRRKNGFRGRNLLGQFAAGRLLDGVEHDGFPEASS